MKPFAPLLLAPILAALAGCATPGPLHRYTIDPDAPTIVDHGPQDTQEVPSFLEPGDRLIGFAYDPYTDHFFLRLAPGNHIRVVDRPARAIKREFTAARVPESQAERGDLAVRPRDGHLFLTDPAKPALIELTRYAEFVREIRLERLTAPPAGVACDVAQDQLFVLHPDGQTLSVHDLSGHWLRQLRLSDHAGPCLAFDAATREFYAPLARENAPIAVFDETGKRVRTTDQNGRFVDVGPRSLVRIF